jgi:cyclic pyranopterin phosphate synthase
LIADEPLDEPESPESPESPEPAGELTHLDAEGHAQMVDVGGKAVTEREAVAKGSVVMRPETLALVAAGELEKGDALATARIAGIMAAKQAPSLIPLCHPIPLSHVAVELELDEAASTVHITATVRTNAQTGVEMEAMTAVSVAALTIYDMCKAVDRGIRIEAVRLVRKTGGKSGDIILE